LHEKNKAIENTVSSA